MFCNIASQPTTWQETIEKIGISQNELDIIGDLDLEKSYEKIEIPILEDGSLLFGEEWDDNIDIAEKYLKGILEAIEFFQNQIGATQVAQDFKEKFNPKKPNVETYDYNPKTKKIERR